jgi:hypothetical protein
MFFFRSKIRTGDPLLEGRCLFNWALRWCTYAFIFMKSVRLGGGAVLGETHTNLKLGEGTYYFIILKCTEQVWGCCNAVDSVFGRLPFRISRGHELSWLKFPVSPQFLQANAGMIRPQTCSSKSFLINRQFTTRRYIGLVSCKMLQRGLCRQPRGANAYLTVILYLPHCILLYWLRILFFWVCIIVCLRFIVLCCTTV